VSNEQWKQQRMFCCEGHVFDFKESVGNVTNKRCPICGNKAKLVDIPISLDRYLYINADQKYYDY